MGRWIVNRCNMWGITAIVAIAAHISIAEIYENSSHLCDKCSCRRTEDNSTLMLNCAKKGFEHTIANWPGKADKITASFSYNNMTTLERLPGSDAEIEVAFDHCGIVYLNTGLFEGCARTVYLDLSHNLIDSNQLSSDVFKGPFNNSAYRPIALKHLNLAYNKIHSLNYKVFEHLHDLQVLNLEGNHFRILDPTTQQAIASVYKLLKLNLANNQLTELALNTLTDHSYLKEIDLSRNELDFVPYSLGFLASTLEKLTIDDNPIIEFTDRTFLGFKTLKELSANNLSKLQTIRDSSFKPLQKLRVLKLNNNKLLKEIDGKAFDTSPSLRELYLNDNSLIGIKFGLLSWSHLEVLEMRGNSLFCDCDLYKITIQLSDSIKRNKAGPWCIHPRRLDSVQMFELSEEICLLDPVTDGLVRKRMGIYGNVNIMRLALVTTSVIFIVFATIASLLMYSKYKAYKRSRGYPYPSQVIYTPLAT